VKSKKDPTQRSTFAPRPSPFRLQWTHGLFFLVGVVLTVVLRGVVLPHAGPAPEPRASAQPPAAAAAHSPWGQLEITEFDLCRPPRAVPDDFPPPPPLEWHFEGLAERQVEELIEASDLTAPQRAALRDRTHWRQTASGWRLSPPLEVVQELSAEARQRIYAVLGRSQSNPFHCDPFRFAPEKFDGWLAESGLTPEHQALFRRLSYRAGDFVCFSDLALLERVCTREELVRLDRSIAQTPALLVKVRISSPADIEPLLRYWSHHEQTPAMKPLLEALARVPGGVAISVSALFPPFPRRRLYTFPDPKVDSIRQDCFWTAMNFFNDPPDPRFSDWRYTAEVLHARYKQVTGAREFGDVLLIVDQQQRALHACVYVADDVVFTKNGADLLQPWVLMRLSQVMKRYPCEPPARLVTYRRIAT
jgi:hypothetical protein